MDADLKTEVWEISNLAEVLPGEEFWRGKFSALGRGSTSGKMGSWSKKNLLNGHDTERLAESLWKHSFDKASGSE